MINYISKQQLDECFDDLAMVWYCSFVGKRWLPESIKDY